jgi:hypothetical protein
MATFALVADGNPTEESIAGRELRVGKRVNGSGRQGGLVSRPADSLHNESTRIPCRAMASTTISNGHRVGKPEFFNQHSESYAHWWQQNSMAD